MFPRTVYEFFKIKKVSSIQAMPAVWRTHYWISWLNCSMGINIGLNELDNVYDLLTFGNSHFLLKVKTNMSTLVLKSKHNDGAWKEKYFFVRRNSIPNGNLLQKSWVKRLGFHVIIPKILEFTLLILFNFL